MTNQHVAKGGLSLAIEKWKELLGRQRVLTDLSHIDLYARSSSAQSTIPSAIVLPESRQEVQDILRIANEHKVAVYPISRGHNWGYGDACAVSDGQVILDLQRMNRILEVNAELGYAVIEPGVSQKELSEHLKKSNIPFLLDVTGAGPDASIVGNILERGFGHTPYGDHFSHSAGYEVVLAGGECVNTGFGRFGNSQSTYIYKYGLGPSLDGLFTQSNFGVVTKMGIWLMPRTDKITAFLFTVKNPDKIGRLSDALKELRMSGVCQSTIHVANDLKVAPGKISFPAKAVRGRALSEEMREQVRRDAGVFAWNGMGALYGPENVVNASKSAVRRALKDLATVYFFDENSIEALKKWSRPLSFVPGIQGLLKKIETVDSVFALLNGIPTDKHLGSVGWQPERGAAVRGSDPLNNEWGFYWLSPVIPLTARHVTRFLALIEPIFKQYDFDPMLSFSVLNSRAACCVSSLCFDKGDKASAQRARECYDALLSAVLREGYAPYRVGIQSMRMIHSENGYGKVVERIKQALDPNNIISPGRYS